MSDEFDDVRRYVSGIDPPDAQTMARVGGRLDAAMTASAVRPGRKGRTRPAHTVRWTVAFFVVLAVGLALLVPTGHRTPTHVSGAHVQGGVHLQDRLARRSGAIRLMPHPDPGLLR